MTEICFKLNGLMRTIQVSQEKSLLKLLRDDFHLTGAKEGCNKGLCGTCAVLVDGKVIMSCHYPAIKANGAEIITVEGIGTPENPHPIQQAFIQVGAIQCGFCTPGMIIRAKALLDINLNPTWEEITKAFNPHLCRCTGYAKIFEAVELAAKMLREGISSLPVNAPSDGMVVGKRLPRKDALAKATGTELYAADLDQPDMVHIKILRSPYEHARIVSIKFDEVNNIPGVIGVLTAKDVQGTNRLKVSRADQPILCDEKVRFIGDPVAAIVAISKDVAEEALKKMEVIYEPLVVIKDFSEAIEEGALPIHADHPNLLSDQSIIHGDINEGFKSADIIVEKEFTTQWIEHAYLENDAGIAYLDSSGQLVIQAGSQNIHQDQKVIAEALGISANLVRIIQTPTGGAFGGKLDISVQGVLGLAALKFKKPVKLVYSREETSQCTTKRHSFQINSRLGMTKSGKLMALDMRIVTASGAYASFSKSVMNRAIIHATGPYCIPNVYINGKTVYTNGPIGGAMRGFGAPQVNFAIESQLDSLAEQIGLNPLEIRKINCYKQGDTTATDQVFDHEIGMEQCLNEIEGYYREEVLRTQEFNSNNFIIKRGVGIAGMWFGPGKSNPDVSEAYAELHSDGKLWIWIGAADMGQGSDTVFAQIAAQELGVAFNDVIIISNDTQTTPDGGYSSGSRQTYMSGEAVRRSVAALRSALMATAAGVLKEEPNQLECLNGLVFCITDKNKQVSLSDLVKVGGEGRFVGEKVAEITTLDPVTGAGIPHETYTFGCQLAVVEVNTQSGEVKVFKLVAIHDSGTPINPMSMEGQVEGGLMMGLGYALMEEYIPEETMNFARYRIPRAKDAPEMLFLSIDVPRPGGPYGASGIAESALVPTASAIINAIYQACSVRIYNLPATKNKIIEGLQRNRD